ncbi:hypothetical protein [Microbacterium sp. No. 7]|uniref:hypothetical protein n=1 Tax=Microbacterium sp. No. 7 TaxID=1714373 RepID=UPI0006D2045F|nr:hypothetical protein [Microbacterium sp. No. 7]ALJ20796.1 hypothetical protein AOA12_13150 [Microbacterium sp. No. 7]
MDDWSRVRELAPRTTVGEGELRAARSRLDRAMARTAPRRARRGVAIAVAVTAVAVIVAVGTVMAWQRPQHPTVAATPTEPVSYMCNDVPVSSEAFTSPRTVADLDADDRAAIARAQETTNDIPVAQLGSLDRWTVASRTTEQLLLLGPEPSIDPTPSMLPPRHQALVLESQGDGGWRSAGLFSCAVRQDLGDLGAPTIRLDPAYTISADSTVLHLLVTEMDCASGQDATGRIELVSLTETPATVDIVLGVRPFREANCPSNPPTPFSVELSAPLGDRVVRDAAYATRPVLVPAS